MIESFIKKQSPLKLLLIFSIFLLLVLRVFAAFNLQIDLDERQHFHIAYRLFTGDTLYKDVWEHHGYLLYYLLKPAFHWLPESFKAFSIMRLLLMPFSLISLWLVYRISGDIFNKTTSLLSALLFLLMDIFYIKSLEIRPDGLQLVLLLLAIWSVLLFLRKKKYFFLFLAGFCIGISFWLSVKALYLLFSMGISIPLVLFINKQDVRSIIVSLIYTGIGFAVGLLIAVIPMWMDNLLPEVWQYTVLENFRFADNHKTSFINFRNFAFWIFSYTGILLITIKMRTKETENFSGALFLLFTLLPLLVILYIVAPAVYLQSGLPVVALMAPFAAYSLSALCLQKKASWQKYTLLFLFLFYLLVNTGKLTKALWEDENLRLKQRYTDLETISGPDDRILSRNPDYPFIRTALPYSTLVKGIRMQMGKGKYTTEWLEKNLRESECRIVVEWVDIPSDFSKLIQQYYVPHPEISDTSIFVSGYQYPGEIQAEELFYFDLIAPGPYRLDFKGTGEIFLNGKSANPEEQVFLLSGRHSLKSTDKIQGLHIYYSKENTDKI